MCLQGWALGHMDVSHVDISGKKSVFVPIRLKRAVTTLLVIFGTEYWPKTLAEEHQQTDELLISVRCWTEEKKNVPSNCSAADEALMGSTSGLRTEHLNWDQFPNAFKTITRRFSITG